MCALYLRPMPKTGERDLQLAADLSEGHIGNAVLPCQFSERDLPDFFVKFLPVPVAVRVVHGSLSLEYDSKRCGKVFPSHPNLRILRLSGRFQ